MWYLKSNSYLLVDVVMSYFIGERFNFNDYVHEDYALEDTKTDEILNRFSFSLPREWPPVVIQENYFAVPTAVTAPMPSSPPSSPALAPISDERVAILIPDDDDFYLDRSDMDSPNISATTGTAFKPLKDLQEALDFPKELLLITQRNNTFLYTMPEPASADVRSIWIQAHIPKRACIQDIEYLLLDWAYTYAHLEIVDKYVKYVVWPTSGNCVCQASWPAFLRWIICATSAMAPGG